MANQCYIIITPNQELQLHRWGPKPPQQSRRLPWARICCCRSPSAWPPRNAKISMKSNLWLSRLMFLTFRATRSSWFQNKRAKRKHIDLLPRDGTVHLSAAKRYLKASWCALTGSILKPPDHQKSTRRPGCCASVHKACGCAVRVKTDVSLAVSSFSMCFLLPLLQGLSYSLGLERLSQC